MAQAHKVSGTKTIVIELLDIIFFPVFHQLCLPLLSSFLCNAIQFDRCQCAILRIHAHKFKEGPLYKHIYIYILIAY